MNPRNFFAELKRHNVYKVAVACGVVGWLVMQVAATIVPALHLSEAITSFLWYPDPWSRKARQSSAFQGFAKRIGLVDYRKKNRWRDLCSPTPENGPDAFACR